ncbi:PIN domain-containing protein [Streptacidiphilus carbonis]|uniref:PIN domain-containing protein n=1 Tax=Streptacidiphilus carbonis TaxID=105422 RepID=UPI0005AA9B70|nr:PIN domain-containing protein [Streptacidiphilus carbonis]
MIVLDTNQLRQAGFPNGPVAGLLRQVALRLRQDIALPEMVLIEHLAHHRRQVELTLGKARDALSTLSGDFDADLTQPLMSLTAQKAVEIRETDLRTTFRVLPAPEGSAQEALRREANRLPPAEQEWSDSNKLVKARGARDVLIWLTVLDAAVSSGEGIWFVTADGDFREGKNKDFHPALRAEADERMGADSTPRLRLISGGLIELLQELGEAKKMSEPALSALLEDTKVLEAVTARIEGPTMFFQLGEDAYSERGNVGFLSSTAGILTYEDLQSKAEAFEVDGATWVCAKARWSGRKTYNSISTDGTSSAVWTTTVRYQFVATVLIKAVGETPTVGEVEILAVGPLIKVDSSASSQSLFRQPGELSDVVDGASEG